MEYPRVGTQERPRVVTQEVEEEPLPERKQLDLRAFLSISTSNRSPTSMNLPGSLTMISTL